MRYRNTLRRFLITRIGSRFFAHNSNYGKLDNIFQCVITFSVAPQRSVGDQSKGGFSAKGNAGERDLLITWGGSTLTLIEAVVCEQAVTQDVMRADLESHFQKLLGYGNPRVFFHLTCVCGQDLVDLVRFLESVAETASPPGFADHGRDPIPQEDSRPPGFIARYTADFGEVKVVFLVLNLGQIRQRQAAKTAGGTKSLKAPKISKPVKLKSP